MGPIHPASPPPSGGSLSLSSQIQQQVPLNLRTSLRLGFFVAVVVFLTAQLHLTFDSITHSSHGLQDCQEAHAHAPPPRIEYITKYVNVTQPPKIEYIIRNRTVVRWHERLVTAAPVPAPRVRKSPAIISHPVTTSLPMTISTKKELPSITEKGMIIIFLHIPKTGGTTMSEPFETNPEWRYRMVFGPKKQANYSLEMTTTLQNWEPGTKIFYEYHGGRASPYMDWSVRDDLQHWRAMAKIRDIPFFAFSVFREPLSFAVSHFNFYYAQAQKGETRYYYVENPTEADFVKLSLPNPQCLFCVSSEVAYYKEWKWSGKSVHTPQASCENVYTAFRHDLDWIGTTETLSSETNKLIEQIANIKFVTHIKNKSKDKIKKSELTNATLAHIRNITSYDNDIYRKVKEHFPISMWSNFKAASTLQV